MSFTKGVSFHHETNASSQPTINNNISIQTCNEAGCEIKSENPYAVINSGEVKYEETTTTIEHTPIPNENEFLKRLLRLYMSQKLYWSGKYLVVTAPELVGLISLVLPGYEVDVIINDIEVNCCGTKKELPFDKVESIWVTKDEVRQNFKYVYSNLVALFEEYKVSIKYVLPC